MLQWLVSACSKNRVDAEVLVHPHWHSLASPLPWISSAEPNAWEQALSQFDAVLAVAPETNGVLLARAQSVMDAGILWLGCTPAAISLCSSKRATCQTLINQGVATVPCYASREKPAPHEGLWITKPDDGCGCEGQVRHPNLDHALERIKANPELMLQPWLEGAPKSLSLWIKPSGEINLLSVNHQAVSISPEGLPHLDSLSSAAEPVTPRHQALAKAVVNAIPGLSGMVGIDFMESATGELVVLEVNPRMTTSFTGLEPFWLVQSQG